MTIKREINGQTVEIVLTEQEMKQVAEERQRQFVVREIAYCLRHEDIEEELTNDDIIDLADEFIEHASYDIPDPAVDDLSDWLESRFY